MKQFYLTLSILTGMVFSQMANAQDLGESYTPEGPVCIFTRDPIDRDIFIKPAPKGTGGIDGQAGIISPTATFIVNWPASLSDPNAPARVAFQYAVDIWAYQIASDVPIVIDFTFEALGGTTLGSAGPATLLRNFSGAPEADTYYPIALANKLAGFDLRPEIGDINASFDNTTDWYFGTDGNPRKTEIGPPLVLGQHDFVSVVLHELGHGLGFVGSAEEVAVGSTAEWGFESNALLSPYIFDHFVVNGSNQQYSDFVSPSTGYYDYVTSDDLFVNGVLTFAANGNVNAKIHAPVTFDEGSSYSHWDEDEYDETSNALMTPQISRGEAIHDVGDITRAFFADMGWAAKPNDDLAPFNLQAAAVTDTRIDLTWADNSDVELGFEIHRSTQENSGFAKIGEVEPDVLIYNDLTAVASTTYYYKVFAIGDGPVLSDPTNTVEVTACALKIPLGGTWTGAKIAQGQPGSNAAVTITKQGNNGYLFSDITGNHYEGAPGFDADQPAVVYDVCGVLTLDPEQLGNVPLITSQGNGFGPGNYDDQTETITLPWYDDLNNFGGTTTFTRNGDAPLQAPTANAAQITFSNTGETSTTVSWTNGNGTGRIVIARHGVPPSLTDLPVDGTNYTADSDFNGSGQTIGDSKVVFNGTGNTFTLTGLDEDIYFLSVFEYNTTTNEYLFNTTNPPVNSVETTAPAAPTTDASNIQFSNVSLSEMTISWTNGNGSNRIVVARADNAPTGTPVDATDYAANTDITQGEALGDGVVVYDGNGSSFTLTGLTQSTTYHLAVYEYNGTGSGTLYKTDAPATASQATADPDITPPTIAGALSPNDNAIDILVTTDLIINFDEDVQKGTGEITIHNSLNDNILETIDVSSNSVTIDGSTVTIDPINLLPNLTEVYIQITAGAIKDLNDNDFPGILDKTSWSFTTSDFDCSGFTADNITINVDSDETNCDSPNGALSATVDVGAGPVTGGYTFTWYNSNDLNTPIGTVDQIDGLAGGDYTVLVEDNTTGCEAAKEATVTTNKVDPVLDQPVITANERCEAPYDGLINITVDGGLTNGYTFEWSIGDVAKVNPDFEGGGEVNDLRAGNYTIVAVNDATGCRSASETFTVVDDLIDPTVNDAISVPNGGCGNNASGQLTITGQTNGLTFSWWDGSSASGNPDFTGGPVYSGLAAGSYTVKVTDDATGCESSVARTFTVEQGTQDPPVITAVVTNGEGCGLPGTGSVLVTMSSTNAPSSYNVQVLQGQVEVKQAEVTNGPAGVVIDGLLDGSYTVRVTDNDKGCSTDQSITVSYTAIPLSVPQNVTVGDITDETATVSWNSVAADATYEILYETANTDVLSEVGTATSNTFDLAGLTDSTVYEVSVLAVCDNDGTPDKSDYSAVKTFKTLLLCGVDKTPAPTWYKDADGDGIGIASDVIIACEQPAGYVAEDGDCNDADPDVYPGAPKLPDGKDNDCDGIVDKSDQTITFAPISNSLVSDKTIELEAESTSGLNITFTAVGPVTIEGSVATITGLGDVVITATQAGNDFYNPAANVIRLFKVSKGDQVITFSELNDVTYAAQVIPYTVSIDTDLPLSIAVDGPAENTAEGLQITGVGVVTITASQAGNDLYNAATYARSFEVTKGEQEITVTNLGGPFVPGDSSIITALSSVGLDVSLEVEGPARLVGTKVYFDAAGLVKIIASQEGNELYNSPQPAQLFIDVELAKTAIEPVELPEEAEAGESIALPTTTPGGAPIIYTVTGPATIDADGNLVITGPGLVTLTSTLDENDLEEAEPLVESFCVFPPKPTISGVADEVNQVIVFTSSSPEGNQWIRDNVTVEGATGQTFQIPLGVEAEIQVQVNIDGCESEISEVINGAGQQITGIEDLIQNGQLKAYPNPVLNIFNIELSGQSFDSAPMARLYTLDGQIISAIQMRNEGFNWKTEFDVSQLKQGIYLYQLVEGQTVLTGKFIKK